MTEPAAAKIRGGVGLVSRPKEGQVRPCKRLNIIQTHPNRYTKSYVVNVSQCCSLLSCCKSGQPSTEHHQRQKAGSSGQNTNGTGPGMIGNIAAASFPPRCNFLRLNKLQPKTNKLYNRQNNNNLQRCKGINCGK